MPSPPKQPLHSPGAAGARLAMGLAIGLLGVLAAGPASAAARRAAIDPATAAVLADEKIYLEAAPRSGESLVVMARRLSDNRDAVRKFAQANGGLKRLRADLRYRVPYALLSPVLQLKAVQALFPSDRLEAAGWRHKTRGEGLWQIAVWFTGEGGKFTAIRKANKLADDPRLGQLVLIPTAVLAPAFRDRKPDPATAPRVAATRAPRPLAATVPAPAVVAAAPPAAVPASVPPAAAELVTAIAATAKATLRAPSAMPSAAPDPEAAMPVTAATPYRLVFGHDEQGDYAAYELKSGEALYSSVVVRFLGRTLADDVNQAALEIAKRSGIDDVTSIAIGFPVKIPLDLLQPEFLPAGHPRRLEYEAALAASNKFKNQVTALDLEGITVVLDAGHGGIDTGASIGGVWESTYVYDIALRVKDLLETYTAARVVPTTRDGDKFRLEDRDILSYSRSRAVLTSPTYPIQDSKIGVNLRWYIANSVQKAALREGSDPERVVFLSIHADSLHPSLRGAMVYIPDTGMSGDAFERSGPEYSTRREVRDSPSEDQSRRERLRSEGLSRELAGYVVRAMKDEGLMVDPFKPVREKVIRNRREWVPAVLRYNIVPAKVLIEVCNLGNNEDRGLIQTRAFRQEMAESIVRGLREYYGKSGTAPIPAQIAKAAARR